MQNRTRNRGFPLMPQWDSHFPWKQNQAIFPKKTRRGFLADNGQAPDCR
jgi:hypothetical protein